ncbi:MAG: hypothetical protein NZM11_10715 [Anaerolineales bacterium]|nr:hypothetical protein [Anaerolineales bacterium]
MLLPPAVALPGALMFFTTWLASAVWLGKREIADMIWPALAEALGFGLVASLGVIILIVLFTSKFTRS